MYLNVTKRPEKPFNIRTITNGLKHNRILLTNQILSNISHVTVRFSYVN